jgi:hypothetical protein
MMDLYAREPLKGAGCYVIVIVYPENRWVRIKAGQNRIPYFCHINPLLRIINAGFQLAVVILHFSYNLVNRVMQTISEHNGIFEKQVFVPKKGL